MLAHEAWPKCDGRRLFTVVISGPSQQMIHSPVANSIQNELSRSKRLLRQPEDVAVIAINNVIELQ
jgi:hypothetical protein